MFKKYKIVSPVRFFIFVLFTTMILVFGLVSVISSTRTEAATVNTYVQVEIEENDTLWKIAEKYNNDSMDIRKYIYEIREINDIAGDESIYPGELIFVPIYQ